MNWNVITRDSSPYQGKAKIYISYYDSDIDEIAQKIGDIFLRYRNCAVFFPRSIQAEAGDSVMRDMLKQVQCVVFPIFSNLQLISAYMMEDYQLCISEHIPVIPILMEESESVEFYKEYQKLFHDAQLLMPFSTDKTKLPFEVQLMHRLENIITDYQEGYTIYQREGNFPGKINDMVKGAFRGSIFVSYRKPDRNLAREMIRKIRTDFSLTDIMLWYDEFLTVGESYNDELRLRIRNCDVFLILGTDAVLEEGNYILTDEYPMACRMNKTIILVCPDKRTKEKCQKRFRRAKTAISLSDDHALLSTLRLLLSDKDNLMHEHPEEQAYLLGKAYLEGKFTETDRDMGVRLMMYSAEHDFVPAMQLLAHMYQIGNAVQQDTAQQLQWLSKAARTIGKDMEKPDRTVKKLHSLIGLNQQQGDVYFRNMDFENAAVYYRKMLEAAIELRRKENSILSYATYHILALNNMANVCKYQYKYEEAREYLEEAINVHDTLHDGRVRPGGGLDYMETLKMLADIEKEEENLQEALRLYQCILDETTEVSNQVFFARAYDLRCDVLDCMGIIKLQNGQTKEAERYFRELLSNASSYYNEFADTRALHFISCSYLRLGNLYQSKGDLQSAAEHFLNAAEYAKKEWESEKTASAAYEFFHCRVCAAKVLYALKHYHHAKELFFEVEEQVLSSGKIQENVVIPQEEAIAVYEHLGNIAFMEKRPALSRSYYRNMLRFVQRIHEEQQTAESLMNLAAVHYKIMTSHPYLFNRFDGKYVCEQYGCLYHRFRTERLGRCYEKAMQFREARERMIPINRIKVGGWYSDLLKKVDVLEQYGLKISSQSSNCDILTNDILEMIVLLVGFDNQINGDLIHAINQGLGIEVSEEKLLRHRLVLQLLGTDYKKAWSGRIPESIQFLTETECMLTNMRDYHEGTAFSLRIIMYVMGDWVAELLDLPKETVDTWIEYIQHIDMYIEEQHVKSGK